MEFLLSFAPHVPGWGTDQLFFVLDDETELFIKAGVFKFVGFKVTGKPVSPQTLQIAAHESGADPLALRLRCDTERPKMQVRFVGIETAPTGKPRYQPHVRFSVRFQQRSHGDGQNFWRRKAVW